jgi:hypothetical protein
MLFFGCSKSDDGGNRPHNSLIGNWQLKIYGGGIGAIYYRVPNDSLVVLSLYPDSTFQRWVNRKVVENGKFHTNIVPYSVFGPDHAAAVNFGDGNYFGLLYQVKGDTLSLDQNANDGVGATYWRVK